MNRTAKRALLGIVSLGLVSAAAPPAQAAGETIRGGCFFAAVATHPTFFNDAAEGVIADVSVTTDAGNNPIQATVSCKIQVNGVDATPTFTYSGPGVQVGANLLSFLAQEGDSVAICQKVAYGTGTTTAFSCRSVTEAKAPAQAITDVVVSVFSQVVDPTVCPVLARLAGSYPGGVVITSTGDVFLPDILYFGPLYDCPPYDTDYAHAPINTASGPYVKVYFALPPGV